METKTTPCFYCGKALFAYRKNISPLPEDALTVDHTLPRCKGGSGRNTFLVPCCQKCNSDKSGLTLDEYRVVISYRNGLLGNVVLIQFPGEHEGWEGWNVKYWKEIGEAKVKAGATIAEVIAHRESIKKK